jgi:hypothetical protein
MIFHAKPVLALLGDPAWGNNPYRGECWVNAADEAEARGLISGRYADANTNIPGVSKGPAPWMDPNLVEVVAVEAPPAGMSIPNGVVVADRQM